jgi:protein-S-isoprenylcysteine O-methyltransferase Ste14
MNVQTYAGVMLALVSASLAQLARRQLGNSFSVTPKAKELVTRGLYSRLQNPMYLFLDLTICGVALAVHKWYVLLLLVILLPLQIRSSRKEHRLLHEKFGERFETYRRATWF